MAMVEVESRLLILGVGIGCGSKRWGIDHQKMEWCVPDDAEAKQSELVQTLNYVAKDVS